MPGRSRRIASRRAGLVPPARSATSIRSTNLSSIGRSSVAILSGATAIPTSVSGFFAEMNDSYISDGSEL
jgi:hypothetical protein